VIQDGALLLLRCAPRDARAFWIIPGGGREDGESAAECVAREVLEEAGLEVAVGAVLYDVPADPPDGTYERWRTYKCQVVRGVATPGGGERDADITAVRWLQMTEPSAWETELLADPILAPQLHRILMAMARA